MKQNADALSAARASGAIQLFEQFRAVKPDALPAIRLHLIGHSAGGIVHTMLAPRALKSGFDVRTISLLAPAVRIATFDKELGAAVPSRGIRLLLAHPTAAGDRADRTRSPPGPSPLPLG